MYETRNETNRRVATCSEGHLTFRSEGGESNQDCPTRRAPGTVVRL
jgi:hypothetical protein